MRIPGDDSEAAFNELMRRAVDDFTRSASTEQRRAAICRYLKRGTTAGFSTGALVDFLRVSSPSVLERAGYSDELPMRTMEELATLRDDENLRTDCD